jgi:PAS domain S-box-containing protein
MSVVTTVPEILTSLPCTSNGWLSVGNSHHHLPTARTGEWIDRRRTGTSGGSLTEILTRLPAVVLLERMPVPTIAMARDGVILFANTAFAEMVGYQQQELAGSAFPEVFHTVPAEVAALSGVEALTNLVVQLRHCDGWTVRARMSKSLMRRDDPLVLVTFDDVTEQLWDDEQ